MKSLAISIVLYKDNSEEISRTINALFDSGLLVRIFLIDNSPTNALEKHFMDPRVEYKFNNANIGYGSAHNIAIVRSRELGYKYHLVVNPDIIVPENTLNQLYDFMNEHEHVGLVMPKILQNDGSIQYVCKLLPTPFDLIARRFLPTSNWTEKRNQLYELRHFDYNAMLNTACLSGCFMFLRMSVLEKSGMFDPRYFMYLEDYDLSRRIHQHAATIFYPNVYVFHAHKKESYKSRKSLQMHITSAIKYFNKWGWWFDRQRDKFNQHTLQQIENLKKK